MSSTLLWIALYLPELPLEAVNRAQSGSGGLGGISSDRASGALILDLPLAVSDGPGNRPFVLAVNAPAHAAGVCVGMSVAAANALVTGLVVLPRAAEREQQAIAQVAAWAAQFTPSVVLERAGVLLEVSASLKLFGGLARLLGQLRTGLTELGFRAAFGVAPTPRAAWLLARAGHRQTGVRACLEPGDLAARLAGLPLELLDWPRETLDALAVLGISRIGEATALPREGFRRRFGAPASIDLDRALGRAADPRVCFALPERFDARIDLLSEVNDTALLDVPLTRMLAAMEGFLRARGAGALQVEVELEHGRSMPPTLLAVGAHAPERARVRWRRLLRERLDRLELKATVSAVSIKVATLHGFGEQSTSFLPDATRRAQSWRELTERLASRLEPGAMFTVALRDDHRPEQAWYRADARLPPPAARQLHESPAGALGARPVFLLERPRALICAEARPQYQGALEMISGPERIEAGWWDGRAAARDYFVARNRCGEVCWIYREPVDPSRWYLHGVFG